MRTMTNLLLALLFLLLFAGNTTIHATSATLAWDPLVDAKGKPLTNVGGYKLYYSEVSFVRGDRFITPAEAQDDPAIAAMLIPTPSTLVTVNGLWPKTTYFFRLTAYDLSDNESGFNVDANGQDVEILYETPGLTDNILRLWDGETQQGRYVRGDRTDNEAYLGQWSFQGNPTKWHEPGIILYRKMNLADYEKICFYTKTDRAGTSFDFSLRSWPDHSQNVNIDAYIQGGQLDEEFRLVCIPLAALQNSDFDGDGVEAFFFGRAPLVKGNHKIYIDEIHAVAPIVEGEAKAATQEPNTRPGLSSSFPNPFNPTTQIRYHLPQSGPVELSVYNLQGQRIRTLVRQDQQAGTFQVSWDGKNKYGQAVAGGVYFYRLRGKNLVTSGKMLLLE